MPNHQRARHGEMLDAVAALRQEVTRAEQLLQVAINRLRQAEDEGFDEEAARREERIAAMGADLAAERGHLEAAAAAAERQRVLAVDEEIDEHLEAADAAVLEVLAAAEALLARLETAAAVTERITALAASLPPDAHPPRRKAAAEAARLARLRRSARALHQAATVVDLPAPE